MMMQALLITGALLALISISVVASEKEEEGGDDKFNALRQVRVTGYDDGMPKLIGEVLSAGGIGNGNEFLRAEMQACLDSHSDIEKDLGKEEEWSVCKPGLVAERRGGSVYTKDWRVSKDIQDLYEESTLHTVFACKDKDDGEWRLEEDRRDCAYVGLRPNFDLCDSSETASVVDYCTLTEDSLKALSVKGKPCAMWDARELLFQAGGDFDSFIEGECDAAKKEGTGGSRHHRELSYIPANFDRAIYFEWEAGHPNKDFHIHYHGVKEIVHWWDLSDTNLYRTDHVHGCRPYIKKQGRQSFQNSLIYGEKKESSDLARVKFFGTVVGPRLFSSSPNCYAATSSNYDPPSCNAYGCLTTFLGQHVLSIWCDNQNASGLVSGKEVHYEALGGPSCKYVE